MAVHDPSQPPASNSSATTTTPSSNPASTTQPPPSSSLNDLASNVQGQLARDLIRTGELEKRASVMGLGHGGGVEAWKRMTQGIIWDADDLKEDDDEEEDETGLDTAKIEARKARARAAAMAKLMGDEEPAAKEEPRVETIVEEDESEEAETKPDEISK